MNRRTWISKVAQAALVAAALPSIVAQAAEEPPGLRHIFRLDASGCQPQRVRMSELRKGDLFIAYQPEDKWTSGIKRALGDPYHAPAYVVGVPFPTWTIVCEAADAHACVLKTA